MSLRGGILGFLALAPQSGYTLKQRFDAAVGSFWSATQSQIYRELHALADARLVAAATMRGRGKPDRKVYALTDAGRRALAEWLTQPLEPLFVRHPLLVKLVFAAELPPAQLDALLGAYAEGVASTRAGYAAQLDDERVFARARIPRQAAVWRLAIEHGLAWCDAELAWIEHARRTLGRKAK
jgi:DNA-binding PadR family transcriptional regulator